MSSKPVALHKNPVSDLQLTVAKANAYVVNGAAVVCTYGSEESKVIFPDRGYYIGCEFIGLDIDTSAKQNFTNNFGVCQCTKEACCPSLVERWVEAAVRQNINGNHPLLMKSMLVCKRGGVLHIKENGQDFYDHNKT